MKGGIRGYTYMAPLRLSRKKKKYLRKEWDLPFRYSKADWLIIWYFESVA